MKRTEERRSSSARMTAEIKDLLHLFFLSCTTGALFEELCKGLHAPVPGLLPYLTLQITDDKTAEYNTAKITDSPGFPTRSTHYHHPAGFLNKEAATPAHASNEKLHLPTSSPW